MRCSGWLALAVFALVVPGTATRGDGCVHGPVACSVDCDPGQELAWELDQNFGNYCLACDLNCSQYLPSYSIHFDGWYKTCDGQAVCYACVSSWTPYCCIYPGGEPCTSS